MDDRPGRQSRGLFATLAAYAPVLSFWLPVYVILAAMSAPHVTSSADITAIVASQACVMYVSPTTSYRTDPDGQ